MFRRGPLSQQFIFLLVIFGLFIIVLNVYQLWQLPWLINSNNHVSHPMHVYPNSGKVMWLRSKNIGHLNHVIEMFERLGYTVHNSENPPMKWNVLWSFDFPFTKELNPILRNPGYWQKINHLPGTGFVTLKVELATSRLPFVPQAFQMPKEKDDFLNIAMKIPDALWVQKSNNHRGIKIVGMKDLDLSAQQTFVQRFVDRPLLIDGRKFDIGIYTVVTSVNPLRVYVYENEMLLRFCETDYHPLDVNDVTKYVVGDSYTPIEHMPSLKNAYKEGKFSAKDALFSYLNSQGKKTKELWQKVKDAVRLVYQSKEKAMDGLFREFTSKHNFFELVRFDFVIDENLEIWLMEVNMSPNLSSAAHNSNRPMYEQIVFNTLSLAGVASYFAQTESNENRQLSVSDRDIAVDSEHCVQDLCLESCDNMKCHLCHHCLSEYMKNNMKQAYLEHIHRGNFRRVAPQPLDVINRGLQLQDVEVTTTNFILDRWFHKKCEADSSWCQ